MGSLLHLAWMSLLRNPLSAVMMVLAVAVGTGFQIPNSANLEGYNRELFEEGVVRSSGHLVVTSGGSEPVDGIGDLRQTLSRLPFVEHLTHRYQHGGVLFRQNEHLPAMVSGVGFQQEQEANGFCARVIQGACPDPGETRRLVVGQVIADKLHIRAGDRVRLVLPFEEMGRVEQRREKFITAGILQGGGFSATDYGVFLPIEELWEFLGWDDTATGIQVYVDRAERVPAYLAQVRKTLPGLAVTPWDQANDFVVGALAGNRAISAVSMTMTILAVLVSVLALLFIHVLSERKQIATLLAIGLTRADLFRVYLWRAALVGLAGVALGTGLGLGLCAYFSGSPIFSFRGFVIVPVLSAQAVLTPIAVILSVTLLGGLIPALKAASANPVREL